MWELFRAERHHRTEEQVENAVASRLLRRHRLTDTETPLIFVAILDESALHWPIGGSEVMQAQLRYLVERAELDTVTLQVLPRSPRPHSGMAGSFSVLRFPEEADPDVLFVDYPVGALHILDIKGVEEVKEARVLFDRLRSEALSPQESVALIERLARELYA